MPKPDYLDTVNSTSNNQHVQPIVSLTSNVTARALRKSTDHEALDSSRVIYARDAAKATRKKRKNLSVQAKSPIFQHPMSSSSVSHQSQPEWPDQLY